MCPVAGDVEEESERQRTGVSPGLTQRRSDHARAATEVGRMTAFAARGHEARRLQLPARMRHFSRILVVLVFVACGKERPRQHEVEQSEAPPPPDYRVDTEASGGDLRGATNAARSGDEPAREGGTPRIGAGTAGAGSGTSPLRDAGVDGGPRGLTGQVEAGPTPYHQP
jgi:hypothetical protein